MNREVHGSWKKYTTLLLSDIKAKCKKTTMIVIIWRHVLDARASYKSYHSTTCVKICSKIIDNIYLVNSSFFRMSHLCFLVSYL